jgi:alkylation response protein AidB-like acyl-CoA dehydrogenase
LDFAFSDEQQMLRDSARGFLAERSPLERVIELAQFDEGWDRRVYAEMAGLGWTGLSVPEDAGGSGMGFLEEAVLFEELGYALYPGPFFSTVGLALPLLQGSDLARSVAAGEARATVAWAEPGSAANLTDPGEPSTKAEASNGSWTLSGEKTLVPDLAAADVVAVVAGSAEGTGVWAVAAGGDGVEVSGLSTMDTTRRLGRLRLDAAPARELVAPGEAAQALDRLRLRAFAALGLEAVGVARRALELAQEHAVQRQQFGKPIGAYQAVSHKVSDVYMETELARSLAYWAAWCVEVDDDNAGRAALSAKFYAAEAAVRSCERAIQVHGGIGFTWEHVLHRLYKRAQWIESFEGFGAVHRAEVAASLLG